MENELEKSEMTFVNDIKKIIQDGRNAAYSAVSSVMIQTYWNIGKRIVEQEQNGKTRAEYGTHLIDMLATELTKEFGKNFSRRNLFYYRKFYEYFPNQEIVNACVHNLTWTHYRALLRVSDENARLWYLKESSEQNWASRTLDRNIATQYYYRLLQSPKKEKVIAEMKEKTSEYQDVGQMDMYVRMYDELKCKSGDNPTIGILLCGETSEDIARYSILHDSNNLFAAKYMPLMPTEEELRREVEQQKDLYRLQQEKR